MALVYMLRVFHNHSGGGLLTAEPRYYEGKTAAKKAAMQELKPFKGVYKERRVNSVPICEVTRGYMPTTKANLLGILRGDYPKVNRIEGVECLTVSNDGKIYFWDGRLIDNPDYHVGVAEQTLRNMADKVREEGIKAGIRTPWNAKGEAP